MYNGLERSVPLSLGYKPRLIDPVDKFDNTSVLAIVFYLFLHKLYFYLKKVVSCDTGLCEDRDYEVVVQFEASPEPDEVGIIAKRQLPKTIYWTNRMQAKLAHGPKKDKFKERSTGGVGDASQWQPAKDRGEWKSFLCHGKGHKALVSDYENFIENEIFWAANKSIGD